MSRHYNGGMATQQSVTASRKHGTRKARGAVSGVVAHEIFNRLRAANPEPKGELESVNDYTFLVAVVLSAQTTDAGVNKATRALFAAADTPEKMVALGEENVRNAIRTIGLYRAKAKNVIALSQRLIAAFGGTIPRDRALLETLPGVGRKTANVVANNAFGDETFAVGHACVSRCQPPPARTRQNPACRRAGAGAHRPPGIQAARPSLAHSARALHVQSAAPALPHLSLSKRCAPAPTRDWPASPRRRALEAIRK